MMDIEEFHLIEVPGGDRRYIERNMTPARYASLKAQKKGTRIFKVVVAIPPRPGATEDKLVTAEAEET